MSLSNPQATLHSGYLSRPDDAPWIVGLASSAAGSLPYPLSKRDVEADTAYAQRVFAELGLRSLSVIATEALERIATPAATARPA